MSEPVRAPEVVLKEAAQWLREHGWCRNDAHGKGGSGCTIVAVLYSAQPGPEAHAALDLLRARIGAGKSIAIWNRQQTLGGVLNVLEGQ